MLGMNKENVEKLVRTRIAKHKENPTAVDDEIDPNAFNPIQFIIDELKRVHQDMNKWYLSIGIWRFYGMGLWVLWVFGVVAQSRPEYNRILIENSFNLPDLINTL